MVESNLSNEHEKASFLAASAPQEKPPDTSYIAPNDAIKAFTYKMSLLEIAYTERLF